MIRFGSGPVTMMLGLILATGSAVPIIARCGGTGVLAKGSGGTHRVGETKVSPAAAKARDLESELERYSPLWMSVCPEACRDEDLRQRHDALGRVTTLTHSIVGLVPMVTFTQAYDAAGRRADLKTQINGTAEFVNQWAYDPLGRVVRITQGPQPGNRAVAEKRVDFSYDAAGQLTALARYADLSGTQLVAESSYSYDQAGRLRNLSHFQGQTTFVEHTWNFDAAGRMTQYVNSVDGMADYTSDAAGQLTAADYDYQNDESYEYDANGNGVLANGSTYTTGTNNRLLSDGTYRYLYDAEGNRTHRFIDANQNGQLDQGDSDITHHTWDHRNRLVKVEHRPGYAAAVDKVVEYFCDYQNRWVRKALDSDGDGHLDGRRIFIYDGNQIVMDFRRANSQNMQIGHLRERYLWGPALALLVSAGGKSRANHASRTPRGRFSFPVHSAR